MAAHRKIAALGAASVMMFLGASCTARPDAVTPSEGSVVYISADYPEYGSTRAAIDSADDVVVVEVGSSRQVVEYPEMDSSGTPLENPQSGVDVSDEDLEAMSVITTVTTVEVVEVISGDLEVGDSIEVSQLGGTRDGVTYVEENTTFLEDVESPELLLVLNDFGDGKFDLVNPVEGVLEVSGNEVEPLPGVGGHSDVSSLQELREHS